MILEIPVSSIQSISGLKSDKNMKLYNFGPYKLKQILILHSCFPFGKMKSWTGRTQYKQIIQDKEVGETASALMLKEGGEMITIIRWSINISSRVDQRGEQKCWACSDCRFSKDHNLRHVDHHLLEPGRDQTINEFINEFYRKQSILVFRDQNQINTCFIWF